MPITLLTNVPTISSPANFSSRADNVLGVQLNAFATQVNELAAASDLNDVNTTSVSSNLIGLGSKTFTLGIAKSISPGMYLIIADTAAPSTNRMYVQVTSYVSTTGVTVVNAIDFIGTGTKTAWTITFSGGYYTLTDSYVRLDTANGYGTTNLAIRRFTNIVGQAGSDITYTDSATAGGLFSINTAGIYVISYNDQFSALSGLGVSLNSVNLSSAIGAIPVGEILCVTTVPAINVPSCASYKGYIPAGVSVRAHTGAISTGTATTLCQFSIARVN